MQGKNAGKTRPRNRLDQDEVAERERPNRPEADILLPGFRNGELALDSVPWPLGDCLSYFTFPLEMKPHRKNLIYQCNAPPATDILSTLTDTLSHVNPNADNIPYGILCFKLYDGGRQVCMVSISTELRNL